MITKFKIFENNDTFFSVNDLVKYKYSDQIYKIYKIFIIDEKPTRLGYQSGFIVDIKTGKKRWEVFNKLTHLTEIEEYELKYNI